MIKVQLIIKMKTLIFICLIYNDQALSSNQISIDQGICDSNEGSYQTTTDSHPLASSDHGDNQNQTSQTINDADQGNYQTTIDGSHPPILAVIMMMNQVQLMIKV